MYSKLMKFKEEYELTAFYTNEQEGDKFLVGYIQELIDDKILILNVGIHGEFDGYTVMYIDNIFRMEISSRYLNKIKKLQSFNQQDMVKIDTSKNLIEDLLNTAKEKEYIVAVVYGDDLEEVSGLVISVGDSITILQINEYGEEDGETYIHLDIIDRIVMDDAECRDIKKLYHYGSTTYVNN